MMSTTTTTGVAGSPVFCAGPMFSSADQKSQRKIVNTLRAAGLETYLALDNGVEVAAVLRTATQGIEMPLGQVQEIMLFTRKIVFALDVYQAVQRCRSLVFNMDGRVPDEGTVMEATLAYASCKPVVIYKTSPITLIGGFDSPMLQGMSGKWTEVSKRRELPAAITAAVAARPASPEPTSCQHLADVCALGALVWDKIGQIQNAPKLQPKEIYALVQRLEADWSTELNKAFGG